MALFDDIAEIKKYVTINVSTNINDLLPFIDRAIEALLFSIMPASFFDEIIEKKAIGTLTPLEAQLVSKMQMPVANYCQYLAIPAANVQQSSTGIHIVSNENKKTAFQWQINQLREAAIFACSQGLDSLGAFLAANETTFTDWRDSELEQARRRRVIGNPGELARFVFIGGSFLVFWKLGAIIQRIQDLQIANLFPTPEDFIAFLDAKQAGILTQTQVKQLHAMQGAAASLAVAAGIDEMTINYTSAGIVPILAADTGTSQGAELSLDRVRHFVESQKTTGKQYLEIANQLINQPPAPEASGVQTDPESRVFYL